MDQVGPRQDGEEPKRSARHDMSVNADRLGLIVAFVMVAEKLSFIEAANLMQVTASTVSRKITRLEELLGVRLFNRTTRTVALTEAGRIYQAHCRTALEELSEADAQVTSMHREPQGKLRLSLPVALGHLHMSGMIAQFLMCYPKISISAEYSDRFVDIINEDFDLTIRIGSLPDSSIIARKLASVRRILVASPAYVERFGMPSTPMDLAKHQCVRYALYRSSGDIWHFRNGILSETVNVGGSFRCDNSEAVVEVAQAGLGIGLAADYICYRQVTEGKLLHILPEWETASETNIYLCYSSTRFLTVRVRRFVDFIVPRFKNPPWANGSLDDSASRG